jgi:hypothetical protein
VGCRKSTTIGESASGKSLDPQVWKSSAVGMVVVNGTEVRMWNTDGQGEIVRGEGSKEMDGCPLTVQR